MNRNSLKMPRRTFLATTAAGLALPNLVSAQDRPLRIGYVSPQTGPLAVFGETVNFIVGALREALAGGIKTASGDRKVEILLRDSQSESSRAAEVAVELIDKEAVDLMLVSATPDTTNPVSDQCELFQVPHVSTAAPWEAWYFGRGGKPDKGFDYGFHYFFGLDDAINIYTATWDRVKTNRKVGCLFPNDADGAAWSNPEVGLPFHLPKKGYEVVNPGSFTNNTDNFSAHINAFKEADVEIITGVLNPPDWNTFWRQAQQQGFRPRIATIGKALVFPAAVETLGPLADGLTLEVVWSPFHPFKSSITGQTAGELAKAWTEKSGKAWTPPLGWTHSIFEIAVDTLSRSADGTDREANREALAATNLSTIFGPVNFAAGPFGRNVAITPTVGGQWRVADGGALSLDIIANDTVPAVPITAELRELAT